MDLATGIAGRSARPSPAGSREGRLGLDLSLLLYLGFLLYTLVGTNPMASETEFVSGSGSGAEQIAVVGLAALSLLVMAFRARTAFRLAVASWPVWLVLGWFVASVSWAAFPDISLRRVIGVLLVTIVCLGVAAGLPSLRRAHQVMVLALGAVVAADLVVTALVPSFAITEIGVRGFHSQKNVAGTVAMLSTIAALGWLVSAERAAERVLGGGILFASLLLLVLSRSKTSLMLAGLAVLLMPIIAAARRLGPGGALLATAFLAALAGCAATMAVACGVDLWTVLTPGGDTTFTGRTEIWDLARSEIAKRPWTGFGFGSFWDVGTDSDPLSRAPPGTWLAQVRLDRTNDFIINEAHNGYLDLQLQGGYPALVLALLLVLATIWRYLRLLFARAPRRETIGTATTFLLLMLVFLAHNMTESTIWMRGQIFANVSILLGFLAFRHWRSPSVRVG